VGVEGVRLAVITKVHHCMIDGVSGAELLALLMDPEAEAEALAAEGAGPSAARSWRPSPAPSPATLLADEARRRAALPVEVLRAGLGAVAHPVRSAEALREGFEALRDFLKPGLEHGASTPLNVDVGPYRRFDWLRTDLAAVKEIRKSLGGTLNDVVLSVVTGAVRSFLDGRGVRLDAERPFRAQVPVNVRDEEDRAALGNRVAMLFPELPVAEPDPRERHRKVVAAMQRLKASHQARGAELLEKFGDWTAKELLAAIARMTGRQVAFNIVVTNVPGPQAPVHLLGSRMTDIYPLVPLFTNQALGVALFSYDGGLFWGFNADWDAMPDLHDFAIAVQSELAVLGAL
jgi:WS/DGAT/MGAT family acyltransferase